MRRTRLPAALLAALAVVAALAIACGGSDAVSPFSSSLAPEFDFPTGPAVLVSNDYEPPSDSVPSTGAYVPANGLPTLVFVDAIWCPPCALTRPVFHDLRAEYQDRLNLVVLDYENRDDASFADDLGVRAHPAWAVVEPDSVRVSERLFGPLNEQHLRELLDGIVADYDS